MKKSEKIQKKMVRPNLKFRKIFNRNKPIALNHENDYENMNILYKILLTNIKQNVLNKIIYLTLASILIEAFFSSKSNHRFK